jgi:CPA2 family monovalent cation:H+ antiporter-2
VVIPLFQRLRISAALGFMLVGVVVGPFGLGRLHALLPWIGAVTFNDAASIAPVAELGVALLLFMIGLELSFERLFVMRRLVFALGALEVAAATALLGGIAWLGGVPVASAAVIGVTGAMSSTALVVGVLSAERRLASPLGRLCFAVLLFQDLAIVPVLLAIGLRGAGDGLLLWLAALKALAAVGGIVLFGRLALRRLFRSVARTGSPELFLAACLMVVLASALATASGGMSMALGALIGGLLLAGTEYRRQVQVTIEPFKGLFLGVFLISVGLGFDPAQLAAEPLLILGGVALLIGVKFLLIAPAARVFGLPWPAAVQAGLLLGPGGEFSFVVLAVAANEGLLPPHLASSLLMGTMLSMAAIPPLSWLGRRLAPRLQPLAAIDPALLPPQEADPPARVLLAGFGRVGRMVAALLEAHAIPFVAIDRDPDRVARARRLGKPVYWGDITQPPLLRQLGLAHARALVVTLDDRGAVDALVAAALAERHELLIVARARDAAHAAHLYRIGASDAVPETVEASLQLAEAVLVDIGVPMGPVIVSIHEQRASQQAAIRAAAPQAEIRPRGKRLRDLRRPSDDRTGSGSPAAG